MPSKRFAIFFDGTDNTPKDRTNVWRTHELLAEADAGGVAQERLYIQGVGTELGQLAAGSIFGAGVSRKIREAYEWLVTRYVDDAEVYVFGFSRGAFTARSFVQMIANVGLSRPHVLHDWSVADAFGRYEAISMQKREVIPPIWRLRHWQDTPADRPQRWSPSREDEFLLDEARVRVIKIKMAGLWDTVGAIGLDAIHNRAASTESAAVHNVRPTKIQEYGYHALAIDEHRPMFEATLWRTFVDATDPQATLDGYTGRYEQRWFIGAHSDVGGGYGDDKLPDLSLQWILAKAKALGLAFLHTVEAAPGAWHGAVHHSFEAFAGGALSLWDKVIPGDQRHYREIGKEPREVESTRGTTGLLYSINETMDDSVARRWCEDPGYRPPSLVEYFRRVPAQLPAGTSLAQRTERIYANRYWNDTGVYLRANAQYRVTVVPDIGEPLRDGDSLARTIAGEDWSTKAHKLAASIHGKRVDEAQWFALIGTVDQKHPWILSDGGKFSVPVGGKLMCYFNDMQLEAFYSNNSGWVLLQIEEIFD